MRVREEERPLKRAPWLTCGPWASRSLQSREEMLLPHQLARPLLLACGSPSGLCPDVPLWAADCVSSCNHVGSGPTCLASFSPAARTVDAAGLHTSRDWPGSHCDLGCSLLFLNWDFRFQNSRNASPDRRGVLRAAGRRPWRRLEGAPGWGHGAVGPLVRTAGLGTQLLPVGPWAQQVRDVQTPQRPEGLPGPSWSPHCGFKPGSCLRAE